MYKENDIYYVKKGCVVVSASKRHGFVRLTVLDHFSMKCDMIHPVIQSAKATLYKQHIAKGREWTLSLHT